ncbi:MAG: lytic transglycosylase domain-containing protein [Nitrospirae bacterium]|nr:lytic transglycosylase domain-containing protein [Nitrospirota bacterium]
MRIALMVFCSFLLAVSASSADIYKYVDENGVVCYTDAPFGKTSEQVSRDKVMTKRGRTPVVGAPSDFVGYVHQAAAKYDLEPELIKAVIKTESNGNHRAVSRKGAMGLMQLMPGTANDLNVANPFNPEENIEGGARYLKQLIDRFNGNLTLALAAYNSGPKTVEKYGTVPPILETRQYVKKVYSLYNGKKAYALSDTSKAATKQYTPIYKVVLDDGTILFTNATLEKNNKTRL